MERYIIDTNVVSEPLSKFPNEKVETWLSQNASGSYISAITVEELMRGVARLPEGRKKRILSHAIEEAISKFDNRIVSFDLDQARMCGEIEGAAEAEGNNFDLGDYIIAAAAKTKSLTVVTRNVKHFKPLGVSVFNPFEEL